jgi:hypothetical protein
VGGCNAVDGPYAGARRHESSSDICQYGTDQHAGVAVGIGLCSCSRRFSGAYGENAEFDDANRYAKALHEAIVEFNPEIIGISVRNIDDQNMENPRFLLGTVKEVLSSCRKYSNATIVLGGAGYSIFPQATLDFLGADIGIQGEGESSFLTLLERLRDKKNPQKFRAYIYPARQVAASRLYKKLA